MITALDIQRVGPLADGQSFGDVGSYIRIVGVAKGEIDLASANNRTLVDIDKAPRNARGKIEYETDLYILRPAEAARGNGHLLYEVNNRGNKFLFGRIADALADSNDPQLLSDLGSALPLKLGFTIVWCGWDALVAQRDGMLSMRSPIVHEGGQPLRGIVRDLYVSGTRHGDLAVFRLSYEPATLDKSKACLTMRRRAGDERQVVPDDRWEFVNASAIRLLPEGLRPEPGTLYDFTYEATKARVLGMGFLAVRDLASFLRYDRDALATTGRPISHSLAIGFSQGGRFLRDFVAHGFNKDERGRRTFDGVLAHTAGSGRVFLNWRFAQPFRTNTRHEDHDFPESQFPFSTASVVDPNSGQSGSLFRGDSSDPLFMETNTSTEYWQKGASLLHTCPRGERDLTLPANARAYLIAGTQHSGRIVVTDAEGRYRYPVNPHNPMPVLRALLVALDEWISTGRPPPDSQVPTLARGSLMPLAKLAFPDIPGIARPHRINEIRKLTDWIAPTFGRELYRPLICQVDADGNEIDGVRTPCIAVPLGTYTGWNLYRQPYPAGELGDREGSFISFAMTESERRRTGDPRPSIAERYRSRSDYIARVEMATASLLRDRLLLPEDAAMYIAKARSEPRIRP